VRSNCGKMDGIQAVSWLQDHLGYSARPLLSDPWLICGQAALWPPGTDDRPGRSSHTYHSYFIANLRVVLEVEVQAGNQTASKYSSSGLWESLGRLPRAHWPVAIHGDRDWGAQANIARAEREDLPYLFKLRMTKGGKKIVERLNRGADWTDAWG